jgi:hypothetical protein
MKTNLKSTNGILEVLQECVDDSHDETINLESLKSRVSSCKHAIQIFALSLEHARMQGLTPKKLQEITME